MEDDLLVDMAVSKIRLVYITKNFPPLPRVSGTLQYAYRLCTELSKKTDLTVIALGNLEEKDRKKKTGIKTIRVGQPFVLNAALEARKLNPDVVVFGSGLSSSLALLPALLSMRLALLGIPFVLHQLTEFNSEIPPALLGAGTAFVDKVICTNRHLTKYFFQACGKKAEMLLPGFKIPALPKAKKSSIIKIGFFGHYHFVKGPDRLVGAFKELNLENAGLVFDGIDYEGGKMQKMLLKEAKKRKDIMVYIDSPKYWQLLIECDFVALPFRASGSVLGVSMAAVEAMAYGKPVVGGNVSVLSSIIENGKNGFLVETDKELGDAIKKLATDAKLREKMGRNARKTAEQKFDINFSSKEFLEICKRLLR
ncbi:MAG: glycosyltransferase family 4 protein [Candidatus Diapherotrites archaeon]|uniref:Glycosyltransferase family 4 protein n=1 Tax=Candidatus Iainarchaeum sp. TaxID=3101447 RepID=A0A938YVU8_9ARCH|nr:glycosyltransferase family 4 protein [Candidatus Diapherotrites archaeon]